ncbi:MAG: thiol-disulfide oxidoreductase DCC family protein [Pyrinomonadaceae bacterium]|nr:thiol-disulfide oxidoreductase DCC family protein [Pyrinomonadaceae bacterium]
MSAIILFDGVCNFCNSSINFVIEHDSKGYFKFAPLQSAAGEELIAKHGIDTAETDSVILVEDGKAYTHSAAALRIARHLDGIWSLGYWLIAVPRQLRDLVYRFIAKHRYRLFGRRDACMMPTPDVRARFLT